MQAWNKFSITTVSQRALRLLQFRTSTHLPTAAEHSGPLLRQFPVSPALPISLPSVIPLVILSVNHGRRLEFLLICLPSTAFYSIILHRLFFFHRSFFLSRIRIRVRQTLRSLSLCRFPDTDGILPIAPEMLTPESAPLLRGVIFCLSLTLPTSLKYAVIFLVPIDDNLFHPNNYCLISLIPDIS